MRLLVFALGLIFAVNLPVSAQSSREELEKKLQSQYVAIEDEIVRPPSYVEHPDSYKTFLRAWQARLAARFADAAGTVEEIIKLSPPDVEMWRERLDTLRLYSQPISRPSERTIYGDSEVEKRARVLEAPEAVYTDEAQAAKTKEQVRIRLVLSADGSVQNIFPIKSAPHGLTESAMAAARQIKFEPAIRNGQPASQFATFVYDFKNKNAKPYIPRTIF